MQCIERGTSGRHTVGVVRIGPGVKNSYTIGSHVAAFINAWGPVARGMVVRHTCDNPACINPMHLQIGTLGDNRRDAVMRGRDHHSRKTHCPRGHPYSPENTYVPPNRRNRVCRTCKKASRKGAGDVGR